MPRLRFMLTALCGLAAACHAQTLVRMLPVARLAPGEQIVLGDVATVEGPGAEALRVVALWSKEDATARPNRLSPEQVREVLDKGGQNMGRIAVSGGATRVETYVAASAIAAPLSQEPSSVIRSGPSIRSAIPAAIGSHLGVDERDLQLTFDETDAALLNVATTNRTYTIAPLGRSDRQPLHVRVYEGDRLVVAKTVRVGVLVRRTVAAALTDIERQTTVTDAMVGSEERWLPPTTSVVDRADVLGRVSKVKISAGKAIEAREITEQLVVRKGETVVVDCLSGGVVVRAQMRAKSDAKVGDVIEFSALSSDVTGREKSRTKGRASKPASVSARVAGPGKAVMVVASEEAMADTGK
jgi:flagella basal body P-ring formation protein FlgA